MAEALYRKYRPQVFEDVVGQEAIERTLKNAIGQDKVSHAYLFTGPRGTGKTTTARLLAKALLCQTGPTPDPDGSCEDCLLIAEGMHPDVYELDAASRTGVENVREEIISRVSFAPTRGRFKVYIIDEVHMLSTAAFNALLKTLEEPPSHVVFVLCTTDPQKVPETIHSRCQRFDFKRIAPEAMVARLGAICIAEDVEFEGEALELIAHRAEGGLRNALTSLEQIIAFEDGKITLAGAERLLGSIDSNDMAEIISFVGTRDIASCFLWTAKYVETGADLAQFVRDMAEHVRNLYVMSLVGEDVELDVGETSRLELVNELQWFGPDRLSRLMGVLGDLIAELKTSSNPRLAFEIALTRMVRPDSDLTLESLAERVEALESGYSAVAHVLPGNSHAANQDVSGGFAMPAELVDDLAGSPAPATPAASATRVEAAPREAGRAVGEVTTAASVPQASKAQAAPARAEVLSGQAATFSSAGAPVDVEKLAGLANPAALQRVWQAALATLKKQKQSYGVLFMNTKARYDADRNVVKVSFPAESTFVFNTVQKADVKEALGIALEKAFGTSVPFEYVQVGKEAAPSAGTSAVAQASVVRDAASARSKAAAQPATEPESRPAAQPAPDPASRPAEQPARQPQDDYPPYEEVPYEQVPYEELDASFGYTAPAQAAPSEVTRAATSPASAQPVPAQAQQTSAQAAPDSTSAPSPTEPNLTPEGAIAEDPSDVEALLQAGFGGGVVFSEIDEDA